MASHKRSALKRQRATFEAETTYMGALFDREQRRREQLDARRETVRRDKACNSKNRYASKSEALSVIADCAAHGRDELSCYRCSYCGGWHLTSHPR